MLPVTDLSPQIEKLHKSYLEKKSGNIQDLDASRAKEDFDLLKRFYESSAIKAGLVNILRYTHQLISFEEQLSQREKDELSALTDNIENAVFRVGVFGSFSSGKSTLINHLLGNTNILPVDEDRCTAAYTLIQRADDKNPSGAVRIEWKTVAILLQDLQDCAQSVGLGLENLPTMTMTDEIKLLDWVKQNDSQFKKIEEELKERDDWDLADDLNRKKQVALALLQGLPRYRQLQNKYKILDGSKLKTLMQDEPAVTLVQCLQFYHDHPLLRHVKIIDSPGSGSVNLRDEFLAHSLVKQSHALLFLTEATAPISKHDETNLLAVIGKNATGGQINSLFVLANKTDLSDNNPERIVQKITERMEKYFKGKCKARKIYPISCKTGLNLEQFTTDLNHFLQADKDAFFLENTSKNVERFIEKLLQSLDNQLKKHDESLLDISDRIKGFQKDNEENLDSIASHLKSYELIYYKSKQDDLFNIGKTLIETFDAGLPNFKDALQHNLQNASSDNKKDIIKNMMDQFIKDVVQRSTPSIVIEIQKVVEETIKKIEKEFHKIKSELAIKYRVLENVSFHDSSEIGSTYDGLISEMEMAEFSMKEGLRGALFTGGGWLFGGAIVAIGGSIFAGGFSLATILSGLALLLDPWLLPFFVPALAAAFFSGSVAQKKNPKLVSEIANKLEIIFKNDWKDDKKNEQYPINISIKNTFDKKLQEDLDVICKAHMERFNQLFQSTEEKLQAQYNEKQKAETERQMLQRNRGLISEELKFLKNEQAYLQNQLQKLYVNQAVN